MLCNPSYPAFNAAFWKNHIAPPGGVAYGAWMNNLLDFTMRVAGLCFRYTRL